jgi:L-iditol 2-dehydrogenase
MLQRCVFLVGPRRVEVREIEVPEPSDGEVVLKIRAATTCGTDLKVYLRGSHPTMLKAPCPFGHEMTGSISAIGKGVEALLEGDQVIIANSASCGHCTACMAGRENLCSDLQYINGAFAEYILIPPRFVKRSIYHKPSSLVSSIAPMAEPLACVLHGLEMCAPRLAHGAVVLGGGPIGQMFVIELVRKGIEVTLGDLSDERLKVGEQLGASHLIRLSGCPDDDVPLLSATSSRNDLIIEATGKRNAWRTAFGAIVPGGEIILFGGTPPGNTITVDSHRLHYSEINVKGVYHHRPQTFSAAIERLTVASQTYAALINEEYGLAGVQDALESMKEQKILKACIRPDFS